MTSTTSKRLRPSLALSLAAAALGLLASGCSEEMGSATTSTPGKSNLGSTTSQSDAGSSSNTGTQTSGDYGGKGGAASDASGTAVPGNPNQGADFPSIDAGTTTGESSADATAQPDAQPGDTASGDTSKDAGGCNTTDPTTLYLSADDSNSMASATVARGLILQGQYAYKAVRPWEFLNYYDFAYPAALPDQVTVSAELRAEAKGAFRLQVGVRAPDFDEATRRRFQLVLTIDTSSSMGWGTPGDTGIDRARAACTGLVAALDKGDTFSLVRWGKTVEVLVDGKTMTGKDDGKLAALCAGLQPNGDSPFSTGLQTAYSLASQHFSGTAINRVILISDGGANVGQQDVDLIAAAAKNAQGKDDGTGIYLMGAGVGDPWNYNDKLMNAVTDAGKGAYVFLDSQQEAQDLFATALLRHLEVAARNVQVQVTLPPTFAVQQFYGEQISTNKDEVEPQHLAANDAMIFHQVIQSCAPDALTGNEKVEVVATWEHPVSHKAMTTTWSATFGELLGAKHALLDKGAAVVAFCDALKATQNQTGAVAKATLQAASAEVAAAQETLGSDKDLQQIADLLAVYQQTFAAGQQSSTQTAATTAKPIGGACSCAQGGTDLPAMACGLDLCDQSVLLDQKVTSPTGSNTSGTYAAVTQFGASSNALKPKLGGTYALLATGPATGTSHSQDIGGSVMADKFAFGGKGGSDVHNAVEWRLHLKAPAGANGLRFRHVFFSEEYDDYVGSSFNDKFYAILEAGSTNGGTPTVINYTDCRAPDTYADFVCSPGMQFCNPRDRYCYIAINTALSECCWLNGCPKGKAKTNISGTGFECAASQSSDSASAGSSTGWLQTEWPIEPGEDFYLTFHVHDTGDGIFDSEVILDGLEFVSEVHPGTYAIPPM